MTATALTGFTAAPDTFTTIGQITPGAPMNWLNPNGLAWLGLDVMPLAWGKNTADTNAFYPALATRWSVNPAGTIVKVWLRPNAKWSDGVPITSQDLVTTAALEYATNSVYWNMESVKAIGKYEVVYTMAPGSQYNLFLNGVLGQVILPAHEFGSLLPADIWTVIDQSLYSGTDKARLALQKKADATITTLSAKISAFAPKKDISSGSFVVSGVNPGEVVMSKNPDYWGASSIHVNQVVIRNYLSNQGIWNYMIGGQVDQATAAMPTSIKQRAMETPGNVFYTVPSYYANSLLFNEHDYPYDILKVRQAFAYLINRDAVQSIGEPVAGSKVKWIDGLTDQQTQDALTPAERAHLNPYTNNPAKAAQLLIQAGFHKVNGDWVMPNGKPWTASIYVNGSYTDWVQGASVVASELTSFGIPTSPTLIQAAQFNSEQESGKFPLSFWTIALGPELYYAYNRLYGSVDGYNLVGGKLQHATQNNFVNFPASVGVSGIGTVDAGPDTLQLIQSTNPYILHSDAVKLAYLTNEYVPAITTWDGLQAGFINTNTFTDFPLQSPSVMLAGVYYPPVGFWMDMGFIRPKN